MLISHRKKFIYAKTVKTAGTSVESYFERYCMPEGEWAFTHQRDLYVSNTGIIGSRGNDASGSDWPGHMSAGGIRSKIGTPIWDDYFKFCVIRNPFDKLISLFFYQRALGRTAKDENEITAETFKSWLERSIPRHHHHAYSIAGKICLDYYIRYEDLETGIEFVCNKLGLPFEPENIPQLKTGIRDNSIPVKTFYSKELRHLVERTFATEIREFGYSFPF